MPKTRPLCWGGNDDTSIACPVVPEKAAPTPCRKRAAMSHVPFGAIKHIADAMVKIMSPSLKSFLLSLLSPHTPAGSIKSAIPSMNEVMIQLKWSAESEKLRSIDGKAIFTADTKKVPMKEVIATIRSIDWLFLLLII